MFTDWKDFAEASSMRSLFLTQTLPSLGVQDK